MDRFPACLKSSWLPLAQQPLAQRSVSQRAIRVLASALCALAGTALGMEDALYQEQIKPLLQERCAACHGALRQEAGLRLDAIQLIKAGGESGAAVVAGDAAGSLLWERITQADAALRMPPEGKPLTQAQLALVKKWIAAGTPGPASEPVPQDPAEHWAFQPPRMPAIPSVDAAWIRGDLDRLVAARHARQGLVAVGPAAPERLLRRVYLDLIGLPPTRAQVREFLADHSPEAYERVVDQLLESPQYGERWARHWMDVWRYSDPSGYGKEIRDSREHIWRWRDWIVESLNEDKGYDRMLTEMLAADEVAPADLSAARATGFLARNWYKFNRNVWLDNLVEHSAKAFLGVTANCARCHDHKYDPFDQASYYRLRAIFETHDVRDEVADSQGGQLVRAFDNQLDPPTYVFIQGDEQKPDKDRAVEPRVPEILGGELDVQPVTLPPEAFYPALRPVNHAAKVAAAQRQIQDSQAQLEAAQATLDKAEAALRSFRDVQPAATPASASPASPAEAPGSDGKADTTPTTPPTTEWTDTFDSLDAQRWRVVRGNWSTANGQLVQQAGDTTQYRLETRERHPRNFLVQTTLTITGGEQWRSVGLGFDQTGERMNAVYLSAYAGGSKAQVTLQDTAGMWSYPAEGGRPVPLELNHPYQLELAVRDDLLNVRLDGRFVLAFRLPRRTPDKLSLFTFSATARFDSFRLAAVPANYEWQEAATATAPAMPPTNEAGLAAEVASARAKLAAAQAVVKLAAAQSASLKARYAAERVKYGLDSGDTFRLHCEALLAEADVAACKVAAELGELEVKRVVAEGKRVAQGADNAASGKGVASKGGTDNAVSDELQKLAAQVQKQRGLEATAKQNQLQLASRIEEARNSPNPDLAPFGDYPKLGTVYPRQSSGRRLAYARWLTSSRQPLTARVAVNHIWMRHFGQPLVERVFDFGLRSARPDAAELLDYLAVRFTQDGWSMKALHREIVLSGVYRFTSTVAGAPAENLQRDPDNLALWRANARRMDAEVVRDSLLHVGGELDLTRGGPPLEHTAGQTTPRRSLYFRQDKERQMTFLALFDGAKVNECYQRPSTVAPQQALAMFNSQLAARQAQRLAETLPQETAGEFLEALFLQILSRPPTAAETRECLEFLQGASDPRLGRKLLARVLLNHNDFVTIR